MPELHITKDELEILLQEANLRREISGIHLHQSWLPDHASCPAGNEAGVIEALRHYQRANYQVEDIAQHFTIDPQGGIWLGRSWEAMPASAPDQNGTPSRGPLMVELIGNFEEGHDKLEGPQKESLIYLLASIAEHLLLVKDIENGALQFFFRENIAHAPQERAPEGINKKLLFDEVESAIKQLQPKRISHNDQQLSEKLMQLLELVTSSASASRGGTSSNSDSTVSYTTRKHIFGSDNGQESKKKNKFWMTKSHINTIFESHLPNWVEEQERKGNQDKLSIMLHCHGGLVSEKKAIGMANSQLDWWKSNNVYPLYYIWKTGIEETLFTQLKNIPLVKELLQIYENIFSQRGTGWFGNIKNILTGGKDTEQYDNSLEEIIHKVKYRGIILREITLRGITWDDMKQNAQNCFAEDGVGTHFLLQLGKFLATSKGKKCEIHFVGHSAGSILLSEFVKAFKRESGNSGKLTDPQSKQLLASGQNTYLLAPAIRSDEFKKHLMPESGPKKLSKRIICYTMCDELEREDNLYFKEKLFYNKSLLYLISGCLEDERHTPILGMEKCINDDPDISRFFQSFDSSSYGRNLLVLSKTKDAQLGYESHSTTHGGFDNDPKTMNSVARLICGRLNHKFPDHARDRDCIDDAFTSRALPLPNSPWQAPSLNLPRAANQGVIRGLCIGIDKYKLDSLSGCVNDAITWENLFCQLGAHQVHRLHDEQATREAILESIHQIIRESRPGDTAWIQFAGHGSTIKDVSGDEFDQDTPLRDEILCPYDIDLGEAVVDDEIAELIERSNSGVKLVFFFDCCHSGTGIRAYFNQRQSQTNQDVRARFLSLPSDWQELCEEKVMRRLSSSTRTLLRASNSAVSQQSKPANNAILFAACRSSQLANEVGSKGIFTTAANATITALGSQLSVTPMMEIARAITQQVEAQVTQNPGLSPQTPEINCPAALQAQPLPGLSYSSSMASLMPSQLTLRDNEYRPPQDSSFSLEGIMEFIESLEEN